MNICYLADHQEVIPILTQWFYDEWSYLHPQRTFTDFEQSITERANRDSIPLAMVAFEGKELVGTICLKESDLDSRQDLTPWLAGLYVAPTYRGQGIGATLVQAIEEKAVELGIKTLYLYTPNSETFYHRLGWQIMARTHSHGYPVCLMNKNLQGEH